MPTTVLIAFDKFKDALTAEAACAIAAAALPAELPYVLRPLTDGGEGFVTALLNALGGRVRHQTVTGPLGDPVTANWGSIGWSALPEAAREMLDLPNSVAFTPSARIAFVEAASTCGLMQVPAERRNPAETSSTGLGQILRHVTEADIVAIVIGLGGSATNDLGLGALAELGLTCHDSAGRPITPPVPQRWAAITELRGEILPLPPSPSHRLRRHQSPPWTSRHLRRLWPPKRAPTPARSSCRSCHGSTRWLARCAVKY